MTIFCDEAAWRRSERNCQMFADEQGEVLVLLGVFAVHNVEEIAHLPKDLEKLPTWMTRRGPWADAPSSGVATGLLTVAVSAACLVGVRSEGLRRAILLGGPSAALAGNAGVHIGRALIQRCYHGGLASAPVMAVLAGRIFLSATRSSSPAVRRRVFAAGNLASLPLIVGALRAGRALTRFCGTFRLS